MSKFSLPKLRAAYDDHSQMSDLTGLMCEDESRTAQSFKDESDINILVRRFGIGEVPVAGVRAPFFGDFTGLQTPHEMAQALVEAQRSFMRMPAVVRAEFDNDPHRFVEFCSNDENYDRICDLGLLAPEPMQKRMEARRKAESDALEAKVNEAIQQREKAGKPA